MPDDDSPIDIPLAPEGVDTPLANDASILTIIPGQRGVKIRRFVDLHKLLGAVKLLNAGGSAPAPETGDVGDYAFSTIVDDDGEARRYLYGPKSAQGWGAGAALGGDTDDVESDIEQMENAINQIQSDLRARPAFLTSAQQAALAMFRQGFEVTRISPQALINYPKGYDLIHDPDDPWTADGVIHNGGQEVSNLGATWNKQIYIESAIAAANSAVDHKTLLSVLEAGVGVWLVRLEPDENDFTRRFIAVNDHTPAHAGDGEVWHSENEHPQGYALRKLANGANGEIRFQTINRFPANTTKDDSASSRINLDLTYAVPNSIYEVTHSAVINLPIANGSADDAGAVAPDNAPDEAANTTTQELYGWGANPVRVGSWTIKVKAGAGGLPVIEIAITALSNNYVLAANPVAAAQHFSYHTPEQVAASDHAVYITDEDGDLVVDSDLVTKIVLGFETLYYPNGALNLIPVYRELEVVGNHQARALQLNDVTAHWSLGLGDNDADALVFGDYADRAVRDATINPAGSNKGGEVARYLSHAALAEGIGPTRYGTPYVMGYIAQETERRAALIGDIEIDNGYARNALIANQDELPRPAKNEWAVGNNFKKGDLLWHNNRLRFCDADNQAAADNEPGKGANEANFWTALTPEPTTRSSGNLMMLNQLSHVTLPDDYAEYSKLLVIYHTGTGAFKGHAVLPVGYLSSPEGESPAGMRTDLRLQGADQATWNRLTRTLTTEDGSDVFYWVELTD